MTVAIPGDVIDIRDASAGGTLLYDATQAFIPTSVRQEEARLVDKLLPLANVMVRWPRDPYTSVTNRNRLEIQGKASREATAEHLMVSSQERLP